jgi:cytochrome c-type biogenesis protein CcmH
MLLAILRAFVFAGCLAIVVLPAQGAAQATDEIARRIEGKLMAPCCWAEPVSQHRSPVADEMRRDIRRMLGEGRSEQEILGAYVARYGERILTSPPARGFNLVLYILPWVFGITAILGLSLIIRRWLGSRPAAAPSPPINSRDEERIEQELRDLE